MVRNLGPESPELYFLPSANAMRDPSGREVIIGIRKVLTPKSPENANVNGYVEMTFILGCYF